MKKTVIILLLCLPTWVWARVGMDTIRVGLLLPLQAEAMKRDMNMDRFVDFYSGALLAVYEMQNTGQTVEIHTWDMGKSTDQLENILSGDQLMKMDMVIGPVYTQQVKMMSDWSKRHSVKTLLPFSSDVPDLPTNPYLMQFNPSYTIEADAIAEYMALRGPVHCIMMDADSAAMPASIREIQRSIKSYATEYVFVTMQKVMADSLAYYLKDDMENFLLLNTGRYSSLRMVMPQIYRAAQGKKLTLISRYSWQEEPIILPQIYTTVFNHQMDTSAYNRLYSRFYAKERVSNRPCYDLLGYDLMMYVLTTVKMLKESEGIMDEEDIVSRYYDGLQSDILFERVGENGGYQNIHIQCVKTE